MDIAGMSRVCSFIFGRKDRGYGFCSVGIGWGYEMTKQTMTLAQSLFRTVHHLLLQQKITLSAQGA
mgnify:CR=1 FL=1